MLAPVAVKYACHALVQLLTLVIATFIVSIRDESPLATVGFGWYLSYNLGRAFEESSEFFEAPLRCAHIATRTHLACRCRGLR